LKQLRTLRLCDFLLDISTIQTTFAGQWPCLEELILDDISLMLTLQEGSELVQDEIDHLRGNSWLETCRTLSQNHPKTRITLSRPSSNIYNAANVPLLPKYIKKLNSLPGVVLARRAP
jgi:hypothetical protein